jgi:hypothetical protein
MMSSISSNSQINNTTSFESFIQNSKFAKSEDSKLDAYIFRNQLAMSITNTILSTKTDNNCLSNPSIKKNFKAQVEKLQKLQAEVNYMETKIKELENSKKFKQIKVY